MAKPMLFGSFLLKHSIFHCCNSPKLSKVYRELVFQLPAELHLGGWDLINFWYREAGCCVPDKLLSNLMPIMALLDADCRVPTELTASISFSYDCGISVWSDVANTYERCCVLANSRNLACWSMGPLPPCFSELDILCHVEPANIWAKNRNPPYREARESCYDSKVSPMSPPLISPCNKS